MRLDGRPVHFRSARDALAAGIGMVHQELSIVPSLSVAENVFLGHEPRRFGLVAGQRGATPLVAAVEEPDAGISEGRGNRRNLADIGRA